MIRPHRDHTITAATARNAPDAVPAAIATTGTVCPAAVAVGTCAKIVVVTVCPDANDVLVLFTAVCGVGRVGRVGIGGKAGFQKLPLYRYQNHLRASCRKTCFCVPNYTCKIYKVAEPRGNTVIHCPSNTSKPISSPFHLGKVRFVQCLRLGHHLLFQGSDSFFGIPLLCIKFSILLLQ